MTRRTGQTSQGRRKGEPVSARDLFSELPAMLRDVPPRVRSRVCDAVWFAVMVAEDGDAMVAWAHALYALDGAARAVPGDPTHVAWSHTSRRPCETCNRDPHAPGCVDAPREDAN